LHVGLNAKVPEGTSVIRVTVGGESKEITLANTDYQDLVVGKFDLPSAGYHYIEVQGISNSGYWIGDINEVLIGGFATAGPLIYVKDGFYFGRRGPSVHLSFLLPGDTDVQWFYNEITVPEGDDVIGSFFMANGFAGGYFGMQVNSEMERRILFSVWSPYNTDNPAEIPEESKVLLLGKGRGVTTGEFGNEGSGGQSYKVFDWQAGNTYKFLLRGEPNGDNYTAYTAYFYAPEEGEWRLIAGFNRPLTNTYLTRFHSFLENFIPATGFIRRKGLFSNQWIRDKDGNWQELTKAKFTADATARKEARLDYAGGSEGTSFYLENCGFFDDAATLDIKLERSSTGNPPDIDFSQLEVPRL